MWLFCVRKCRFGALTSEYTWTLAYPLLLWHPAADLSVQSPGFVHMSGVMKVPSFYVLLWRVFAYFSGCILCYLAVNCGFSMYDTDRFDKFFGLDNVVTWEAKTLSRSSAVSNHQILFFTSHSSIKFLSACDSSHIMSFQFNFSLVLFLCIPILHVNDDVAWSNNPSVSSGLRCVPHGLEMYLQGYEDNLGTERLGTIPSDGDVETTHDARNNFGSEKRSVLRYIVRRTRVDTARSCRAMKFAMSTCLSHNTKKSTNIWPGWQLFLRILSHSPVMIFRVLNCITSAVFSLLIEYQLSILQDIGPRVSSWTAKSDWQQ